MNRKATSSAKHYEAPRLTNYGPIEQLTKLVNNTSGVFDSGTTNGSNSTRRTA
jgi:hypothetical protein